MAHAKQRSSSSAERPSLESFPTDLSGAGKDDLLEVSSRFGVDFIRLQFTDIMGINKNVEVPRSQFAKALDGEIMFDGSSIEGFVRIEESDMLLKPDLATFRILPYDDEGGRVARLLCDIYTPDEEPFAGCPRMTLKRQLARAKKLGFTMMAGCEAEFFLFEKAPDGSSTTATHDSASYFDLGPLDKGEEIRRVIVEQLVEMGSRSRPRTTRWRRGSTRSTSSTRTRWSRRITSPPSSSWSATWPTATATSPRSCRSRSRGSTAAGCTRTSRCSAASRMHSGIRRHSGS